MSKVETRERCGPNSAQAHRALTDAAAQRERSPDLSTQVLSTAPDQLKIALVELYGCIAFLPEVREFSTRQ